MSIELAIPPPPVTNTNTNTDDKLDAIRARYRIGRGNPVSDDIKIAALTDYANGGNRFAIAKRYGVSGQSVHNWASDNYLLKRLGIAESSGALKMRRYASRISGSDADDDQVSIEDIVDTVQTQKSGNTNNKDIEETSDSSSSPPSATIDGCTCGQDIIKIKHVSNKSVKFCPHCGIDLYALGMFVVVIREEMKKGQ